MACAADVRRDYDVGQLEQRVVRADRLGVGHVESGGGQPSRLESADERLLIDDRTTRRVDQDGAALHHREFRLTYQMASRGRERHVQRDEIRLRQQPLEAPGFSRCELRAGGYL